MSHIELIYFQLKAFYVDLLVPLETNLERDTKVVQVSNAPGQCILCQMAKQ